jgi:leucyl aminopeptidase (aminopeptidase T)
MDSIWDQLAQRIVSGLDLQPGELIELRDRAGNQRLLHALALAVDAAGATPLTQIMTADYLERLLQSASVEHLSSWDRQRAAWAAQVDRVVVLGGAAPDLASATPEARAAFFAAEGRIEAITDARRLPFLVVAVPAVSKAAQLGIDHGALEQHMMPALLLDQAALQAEIEHVLLAAEAGERLVIRSGQGHELRLERGDRPWMGDDGRIDPADRARGAVVSNLPAGSIYTTVIEESAEGSLALPVAGPARLVVLHFSAGRISAIEAASGGAALEAFFDSHSGEPRRISHIGIGLNPQLRRPIGWTLVDEHVHGCMFIAFGENRYMGGQNESSLNIDYVVPEATILVGDQLLVEAGQLMGGG